MNIETIRSPAFRGANRLLLVVNATPLGNLDYKTGKSLKPIQLLDIQTAIRGKGYSKDLIRAFIDQVGPGRRFETTEILHQDTWLAFDKYGILKEAYDSQKMQNIQGNSLLLIPIVHVLQSGGLKINSLRLKYRRVNLDYQFILERIRSDHNVGPDYFTTKMLGTT